LQKWPVLDVGVSDFGRSGSCHKTLLRSMRNIQLEEGQGIDLGQTCFASDWSCTARLTCVVLECEMNLHTLSLIGVTTPYRMPSLH
jgi:hypothetical protein